MGPSPLRHLYPRLSSFASLQAAARHVQLGKRYRPAVLAFNANLEAELLRLQEELRAFTYRPGPYRDRVVHHALCAAMRLYFPSIDLTILRHQLAALIACPGTLWLLDQILANGASHGTSRLLRVARESPAQRAVARMIASSTGQQRKLSSHPSTCSRNGACGGVWGPSLCGLGPCS